MRRLGTFLSIFAAVFLIQGCSKKPKPETAVDEGPTSVGTNTKDSDSGTAMGLQTVNFPYDSFVLDSKAKGVLKANAGIMKDKPSLKIQIEGHCDIRGGIQYNIALGEKRANTTRSYLTDLGVAGDRVTIVSFGKERPIDPGTSEEAHAKNRRANFVVTSE